MRRWIPGWGAQAEVLQPIAMRGALKQEARAMVEKLGRRGPALARVGAHTTRQIKALSAGREIAETVKEE